MVSISLGVKMRSSLERPCLPYARSISSTIHVSNPACPPSASFSKLTYDRATTLFLIVVLAPASAEVVGAKGIGEGPQCWRTDDALPGVTANLPVVTFSVIGFTGAFQSCRQGAYGSPTVRCVTAAEEQGLGERELAYFAQRFVFVFHLLPKVRELRLVVQDDVGHICRLCHEAVDGQPRAGKQILATTRAHCLGVRRCVVPHPEFRLRLRPSMLRGMLLGQQTERRVADPVEGVAWGVVPAEGCHAVACGEQAGGGRKRRRRHDGTGPGGRDRRHGY